MSTKDGGPAFPRTFRRSDGILDTADEFGLSGMSLRDYFAAQAMAAIIAKAPIGECTVAAMDSFVEASLKVVTGAYAYADAMIAAREARP